MDRETEIMKEVKNAVEAAGGHVLSVVFDGLYVLAKSVGDLARIYQDVQGHVYERTRMKCALKSTSGDLIQTFSEANAELDAFLGV